MPTTLASFNYDDLNFDFDHERAVGFSMAQHQTNYEIA
jgi:hypothetical protein